MSVYNFKIGTLNTCIHCVSYTYMAVNILFRNNFKLLHNRCI
jgi:hypothetical protein